MSWSITVIDPPTIEPVSIDEAKQQCHLEPGDAAPELAVYIAAAREMLELHLNRGAMITQTVALTMTSQSAMMSFPVFPVQSIEGIEDADGTDVSSAFTVQLGGTGANLVLTGAWPGPVIVTLVCGYGSDADAVPAVLKLVMLFAISAMYDNRGALPEDFFTARDCLLEPFRRPALA